MVNYKLDIYKGRAYNFLSGSKWESVAILKRILHKKMTGPMTGPKERTGNHE